MSNYVSYIQYVLVLEEFKNSLYRGNIAVIIIIIIIKVDSKCSMHDTFLEYPLSGTFRIPFIRYVQNTLHQVRSEYPSSGTFRFKRLGS
jgi:hypothetical protein